MTTRWIQDDNLTAELTQRFRAWTECITTGDVASLEQYLHPDLVYVTVYGRRYDRRCYLALVESLAPGCFFVFNATRVRAQFGVAQFGVAQFEGDYFTNAVTTAGEDLSAHTRFTSTWVLDDGSWRCLTQQGTFYTPDAATEERTRRLVGKYRAAP
jgi:hypothetical protein